MKNSLLVAVFVSVFSIVVAYPAAYTLARMKFKGKKFFSKTILFTYLLPTSVLYIPLYIFVSKIGLTDNILGLMLIYPTFTLPYVAWILIPHIASIPYDLEEDLRRWMSGPFSRYVSDYFSTGFTGNNFHYDFCVCNVLG